VNDVESVERLKSAIAGVQDELNVLQEAHQELSLAILDRPDDGELHEQLTALEDVEISHRQRQLQRLQSALAEAQKVDHAAAALAATQARRSAAQRRSACYALRVDKTLHARAKWDELLGILDEIRDLTQKGQAAGFEAGLARVTDPPDMYMRGVGSDLARMAVNAGLQDVLAPGIEFTPPAPSYQYGNTTVNTLDLVEHAKKIAEEAKIKAEAMP
jgi:hypothetical protein